MEDVKVVYEGILKLYRNHEEVDVLSLNGEILAELIMGDIEEHGHYLSVRYFVTNDKINPEKLNEELMNVVMGIGSADYGLAYSETTGYLWTNESLQVGNHDLLEELMDFVGKYLYMEIEYSRDGRGLCSSTHIKDYFTDVKCDIKQLICPKCKNFMVIEKRDPSTSTSCIFLHLSDKFKCFSCNIKLYGWDWNKLMRIKAKESINNK